MFFEKVKRNLSYEELNCCCFFRTVVTLHLKLFVCMHVYMYVHECVCMPTMSF